MIAYGSVQLSLRVRCQKVFNRRAHVSREVIPTIELPTDLRQRPLRVCVYRVQRMRNKPYSEACWFRLPDILN
jgi:hypothetical protein